MAHRTRFPSIVRRPVCSRLRQKASQRSLWKAACLSLARRPALRMTAYVAYVPFMSVSGCNELLMCAPRLTSRKLKGETLVPQHESPCRFCRKEQEGSRKDSTPSQKGSFWKDPAAFYSPAAGCLSSNNCSDHCPGAGVSSLHKHTHPLKIPGLLSRTIMKYNVPQGFGRPALGKGEVPKHCSACAGHAQTCGKSGQHWALANLQPSHLRSGWITHDKLGTAGDVNGIPYALGECPREESGL